VLPQLQHDLINRKLVFGEFLQQPTGTMYTRYTHVNSLDACLVRSNPLKAKAKANRDGGGGAERSAISVIKLARCRSRFFKPPAMLCVFAFFLARDSASCATSRRLFVRMRRQRRINNSLCPDALQFAVSRANQRAAARNVRCTLITFNNHLKQITSGIISCGYATIKFKHGRESDVLCDAR